MRGTGEVGYQLIDHGNGSLVYKFGGLREGEKVVTPRRNTALTANFGNSTASGSSRFHDPIDGHLEDTVKTFPVNAANSVFPGNENKPLSNCSKASARPPGSCAP